MSDPAIKDLLPCPFCGTKDDLFLEEKRHSPTMQRPVGALISVVIRHHCNLVPGAVGAYFEVRGREHVEVKMQWNRRLPY